MKSLIVAIVLAATAATAYAACRTYTLSHNGRLIFCMECCNGSHCTTTCN